jgi:hypothetical protein
MKKYLIAAMILVSSVSSAVAQYDSRDYYAYNNDDDRYYYDDEFDWHWDIRVRISDGIQRGLITRREADLLYNRLENVERKEYAYQSDGFFTAWEQQEIWDDVVYLNRRLGLELSDYDRNFYGFDVYGYDRRGYSRWYYQGGYDFFRFDKRGFGSIRLGYYPRPNYRGWYRHQNNRIAQRYCIDRRKFSDRRDYANRGNFSRNDNRNDRDRRRDYYDQYPNNRGRGNENRNRGDNDRSRGRNDNGRDFQNDNERIERPREMPNNFPANGGNRNRDNRIDGSNIERNRSEIPATVPQENRPNFEYSRPSRGSGSSQENRGNNANVEPNNRSENGEKSSRDWNMNRNGSNPEQTRGRRGNE